MFASYLIQIVIHFLWLHLIHNYPGVDSLTEESDVGIRIVRNMTDVYGIGQGVRLYCPIEGDPTPKYTWFKDGKRVQTASDSPATSQITKRSNYIALIASEKTYGKYHCVASNIHGEVKSNEAALAKPFLSDDFVSPEDMTVSVGTTASLHCKAPKGLPKPELIWYHGNGEITGNDKRIKFNKVTGLLRIDNVQKSDSGIYYCLFKNIAGTKNSSYAHLRVEEKPQFLVRPLAQSVTLGGDVIFHCQVTGDPEPTILWRRKGGASITSLRNSILPDKSLKIERVQQSDAGEYICAANNSVGGSVEVVAKLSVKESPNFIITPDDLIKYVGDNATFRCQAKGEPKPLVRWVFKDRHYVAPDKDSDFIYTEKRITVNHEGTLTITNVEKRDEGQYECRASQEAGIVKSLAHLSVIDENALPIPVIEVGPQNQTFTLEKTLYLDCKGSLHFPNNLGDQVSWNDNSRKLQKRQNSPLVTEWYFNGAPINTQKERRYVFLDQSRTLQVNALKSSDRGKYTCKIQFQYGNNPLIYSFTEASANVELSSPEKEGSNRYSSIEEHQMAQPPKSVSVVEVNDKWINLRWSPSDRFVTNSNPIIGYMVEYIQYNSTDGWKIAFHKTPHTFVHVYGLKPDTGYFIAVRGVNKFGYGRPYILKNVVYTTKEVKVSNMNPDLLRRIDFSGIKTTVMSGNEIQLIWSVCASEELLEHISSFEIIYASEPLEKCLKPMRNIEERCPLGLKNDYGISTDHYCSLPKSEKLLSSIPFNSKVHGRTVELKHITAASINPRDAKVDRVVNNLKPFNCYRFQIRAIVKHKVHGEIYSGKSGPALAMTFEKLPSKSPSQFSAEWQGNGTKLFLSWKPASAFYANGYISGYALKIIRANGDVDKYDIDSKDSEFVLENPPINENMTLYLAVVNCKGEGPRSSAFKLSSWEYVYANQGYSLLLGRRGPGGRLPLSLWIIVAAAALISFGVCLFCVVLCYRRHSSPGKHGVGAVRGQGLLGSSGDSSTDNLGGVLGSGLCRSKRKQKKTKKSTKFNHVPDSNGLAHLNGAHHLQQQQHLVNGEKNGLLTGVDMGMQMNAFGHTVANGNGAPSNTTLSTSLTGTYQLSNNAAGQPHLASPPLVNKFPPGGACYTAASQATQEVNYADPSMMVGATSNGGNFNGMLLYNHASGAQGPGVAGGQGSGSRSSVSPAMQHQRLNTQQHMPDGDDGASPYASASVIHASQMPGESDHELEQSGARGRSLGELIPPPPEYPPPPLPSGNGVAQVPAPPPHPAFARVPPPAPFYASASSNHGYNPHLPHPIPATTSQTPVTTQQPPQQVYAQYHPGGTLVLQRHAVLDRQQ